MIILYFFMNYSLRDLSGVNSLITVSSFPIVLGRNVTKCQHADAENLRAVWHLIEMDQDLIPSRVVANRQVGVG